MTMEPALLEKRGHIALITLNRPEARNSFSPEMLVRLAGHWEEVRDDENIRVAIVTGAGDKAFCSGADLGQLIPLINGARKPQNEWDQKILDDPNILANGLLRTFDVTKPVIAAINGAAAGVGLVMACYADIRFAVPGAKLTTAHGPLNLPAEYGLSWLLPRLIGGARALELLLSSRKFLTDEAHQIGLVHQLVAPDDLMHETRAYTADLVARVSPEALRQSKRQTYLDFHRDIGMSVREANDLLSAMVKQPDYKEAIRAFLDKRPANWGEASATTTEDQD